MGRFDDLTSDLGLKPSRFSDLTADLGPSSTAIADQSQQGIISRMLSGQGLVNRLPVTDEQRRRFAEEQASFHSKNQDAVGNRPLYDPMVAGDKFADLVNNLTNDWSTADVPGAQPLLPEESVAKDVARTIGAAGSSFTSTINDIALTVLPVPGVQAISQPIKQMASAVFPRATRLLTTPISQIGKQTIDLAPKVSRFTDLTADIKPTSPMTVGGGERGSAALGAIGREVKGFFEPETLMPNGKKWLEIRGAAQGFLDRANTFIDRTLKPMQSWSPAIRENVFSYLDGKAPLDSVPAVARTTARNVRRAFDSVGGMLVKRGMMTEESFAKYKGQYVPYLYLRHLLPDNVWRDIGGPTGRLNMDRLKLRKDLTPETRRAMGWIRNPEIAARTGLSQELKNVGMYDYLDAIATKLGPTEVHPASFVQMPLANGKTARVPLGDLTNEVNLYRQMAKIKPDDLAIHGHLAKLESVYVDATARVGEIPKDFVALPNTPEYGPLRGAYVHKVIARDLRPLYTIRAGEGSRFVELISKINRQGMAAFKVSKTAFNIPTDRKSTRLNSSHIQKSRMPSSA